MRIAAFGLLASAVIVTAGLVLVTDPVVWGQQPTGTPVAPELPARLPVASAGDLMAFSAETSEGPSQVILIDAAAKSMCVYHVDRATGKIALKSVRKFQWDFLIEEFNGVRPLPREIQALLEQR